MDTSKIYEPDYLTCDLIKALPLDKRTGVILNEGEIVEVTFNKLNHHPEEKDQQSKTVKRLRVKVEFREKGIKLWTIHRGNRGELARHFGDNSADWVGKPLRFTVVNNGKMDFIHVEPIAHEFKSYKMVVE